MRDTQMPAKLPENEASYREAFNIWRIVLTFKDNELVIHTLYKTPQDKLSPNPNTKRRLREVTDLTREGLKEALGALEVSTPTCVGSSGFIQREDILSVDTKGTAA
jgi:hypothetical protein